MKDVMMVIGGIVLIAALLAQWIGRTQQHDCELICQTRGTSPGTRTAYGCLCSDGWVIQTPPGRR